MSGLAFLFFKLKMASGCVFLFKFYLILHVVPYCYQWESPQSPCCVQVDVEGTWAGGVKKAYGVLMALKVGTGCSRPVSNCRESVHLQLRAYCGASGFLRGLRP